MNHLGNTNKMVETPRTDAAYAASTGAGIYELFKESQDIERELNAANESFRKLNIHALDLVDRIRRLEEAGDALANHHLLVVTTYDKAKTHVSDWNKAKEAKP